MKANPRTEIIRPALLLIAAILAGCLGAALAAGAQAQMPTAEGETALAKNDKGNRTCKPRRVAGRYRLTSPEQICTLEIRRNGSIRPQDSPLTRCSSGDIIGGQVTLNQPLPNTMKGKAGQSDQCFIAGRIDLDRGAGVEITEGFVSVDTNTISGRIRLRGRTLPFFATRY